MNFQHIPVLYEQTLSALDPKPGGVFFDGTLGGGGHSSGIAEAIGKEGTLIACDLDETALLAAKERLSGYPANILLYHDNFKHATAILRQAGVTELSGAVLDLGVSSPQLDERRRGFSYQADAPLDMRMSGEGMSAADLVNTYSEEALRDILYRYGEENNARAIARAIVRARETAPITTTFSLVEVIKSAFGGRYTDKNPARRTFQALRIEVNRELEGLDVALKDLAAALKPGGVLAVITFHSLEDRVVKQTFRAMMDGCTCPKDFPVCTCGFVPTVESLFRKPVVAGEAELAENPRARSAKLRAIRKL